MVNLRICYNGSEENGLSLAKWRRRQQCLVLCSVIAFEIRTQFETQLHRTRMSLCFDLESERNRIACKNGMGNNGLSKWNQLLRDLFILLLCSLFSFQFAIGPLHMIFDFER